MWIGSGYKCSYRALLTMIHTIHTITATTTAPVDVAGDFHWFQFTGERYSRMPS